MPDAIAVTQPMALKYWRIIKLFVSIPDIALQTAVADCFVNIWQENVPLASLPLMGYSVSKPTEADGIRRDYVFKLQFKNHVYFFRADSAYAYDRWGSVRYGVNDFSFVSSVFTRISMVFKLKLVYCLIAYLRNSIQICYFLSRLEPFMRWLASLSNTTYDICGSEQHSNLRPLECQFTAITTVLLWII